MTISDINPKTKLPWTKADLEPILADIAASKARDVAYHKQELANAEQAVDDAMRKLDAARQARIDASFEEGEKLEALSAAKANLKARQKAL